MGDDGISNVHCTDRLAPEIIAKKACARDRLCETTTSIKVSRRQRHKAADDDGGKQQ